MQHASPAYISPENFEYNKNRNSIQDDVEKQNVWSLGVIIIEIFKGFNPIYTQNNFSPIKNFAIVQELMLDSIYLQEVLGGMQAGLGIYGDFIQECVKCHDQRPNYKTLMSTPAYKQILEASNKESYLSTEKLIDDLKKVGFSEFQRPTERK